MMEISLALIMFSVKLSTLEEEVFHTNRYQKKGFTIMGCAESSEEATMRLEQFIEHGVDPNCIKIHPHNRTSSADPSDFGACLLGSFIGTDSYVKEQLLAKLIELRDIAEKLIKYLTVDFVKKLEVLQKRVLSSILGCAPADFTAHKVSQWCLQLGWIKEKKKKKKEKKNYVPVAWECTGMRR
jgi:hypothetical protein